MGAVLMVIVIASETGAQGPVVVNVKVTVFAVTSAALGVYTAFKAVLLGANVPAPPLQVPDAAEPPIIPFKVIVLPAQMI